jgi:hypothetical protein
MTSAALRARKLGTGRRQGAGWRRRFGAVPARMASQAQVRVPPTSPPSDSAAVHACVASRNRTTARLATEPQPRDSAHSRTQPEEVLVEDLIAMGRHVRLRSVRADLDRPVEGFRYGDEHDRRGRSSSRVRPSPGGVPLPGEGLPPCQPVCARKSSAGCRRHDSHWAEFLIRGQRARA